MRQAMRAYVSAPASFAAVPLFQQAAQRRLVAARQRLSLVGVDVPEVALQKVEHLRHEQQLIPCRPPVAEKIAQQRVELAYAQIFTFLDAALRAVAEMCATQAACGVASAA